MPPVISRVIIRFNSRARMGRDRNWSTFQTAFSMFQLTRPHGARLKVNAQDIAAGVFQLTRPHGARLCFVFRVREI